MGKILFGGIIMKILVTGSNGYLGQGIVKKLIENDHKVIATDLEIGCIDNRAVKIQSNIFDIENPFDFYDKPDVLLHLAWRDGFIHNSKAHIDDLPKHKAFIEKMLSSGLQHISVMGSMHEIGFYEGSIKDNTPCNPMNMYGIGKNTLREVVILLASQYNIKYQWLRGYYIVGNSVYGNSVFSKITKAFKEGKKEFPFTLGQNQYDFLDYEDFCNQTAAAVGQFKINGIINICSGKPEKLSDRVERFINENGYNIRLQYGAFPDREYDSKAVWGDNTIIQKILAIGSYRG